MKVITYKKGPLTQVSLSVRRDASDALYCKIDNLVHTSGTSITRPITETESKTFTRGDFVHSTPFTGHYSEQSPMAGSFDTVYSVINPQGPLYDTYCGTASPIVVKHTSDIGAFVGAPSASPAVDTLGELPRLISAANTKALADLNRSYYSMGIILAERLRTIDYIVSKTKQLAVLWNRRTTADLTKYLQSRKSDRKRIAKDLAGEHLAFVFGLLPLIDEISGLADLLASSETAVITGRGRQAIERSRKETNSYSYNGASDLQYPFALNVTDSITEKVSARTSVSMKVTIAAFQKMRDHGLNPVATFYDIVPLSFLSDFISNTGTYLRSYDPLFGLDFVTGNTSTWVENKVDRKVTGFTARPSGWSIASSGDGASSARTLFVERIALSELPDAVWLLQNNLTLSKAATIASLVIQKSIKPVRAIKAIRDFRYRGRRPKYLPPIKYQKVK